VDLLVVMWAACAAARIAVLYPPGAVAACAVIVAFAVGTLGYPLALAACAGAVGSGMPCGKYTRTSVLQCPPCTLVAAWHKVGAVASVAALLDDTVPPMIKTST
jgi:hypothetical protein